MGWMLAGLLMFFSAHIVTATPAWRACATRRISDNAWRGIVSLAAVGGLVLVGKGWGDTPNTVLFAPSVPVRQAAPLLISLALVLFVIGGGNLRGHIKRRLHHPMLIGVILWATVHLLINGGLRESLLFGSFLAFALYALLVSLKAGKFASFEPAIKWDGVGLVIGLLVAAGFMHAHGWLFGVAAI